MTLCDLLFLLLPTISGSLSSRWSISLDGEWSFVLHEPIYSSDPGFSNMSGKIKVPGSWEAQGFGNETTQMRWQVLTGDRVKGRKGAVGTYSKSVAVPACSNGGRYVLMVDQGIHRHGIFEVNGVMMGEHRGYLTPFEADISSVVERSGNVEVKIVLDGDRLCDQQGCSDALMGAQDDDTDGTNLGGWAGLNGHVSIECRPATFIDGGVGNIIPPHVTHPPVSFASEGQPLEISVAFAIGGSTPTNARLRVFDNSSGALVATADISRVVGNTTLKVTIPSVKLWSPERCWLYSAEVSIGPQDAPLDLAVTRFGVRTISVADSRFMLNGRRVFLVGYGDDAIYPATVSPPREKITYAKRLKMARDIGFNFVRHHSHVLPPEYFEAADELGVMISPELACVYHQYFNEANAVAMGLYHKSWASYIAQLRNHPSIFDWPLCNEMYMGAAKADVFFGIKERLDPTRLMIDQDGACTGSDKRVTNDFCSHQFDVANLGAWGSIALDRPNKYHDVCDTTHKCKFSPSPLIPVISHETGNYNTYPRLKSLIDKFASSGTTIKPYWLSGAFKKLEGSGLLAESENWAKASEQLYALCWKIDIEDQRRNIEMSGYEWWLLQDYWMGNNGIVDTFFDPKPGVLPYIAQFNAPSILLQDGLKFSYVSKEKLVVDISLSNFGSCDLPKNAQLKWSVQIDGETIKASTVAVDRSVRQGDLGIVATISAPLPDIGTTVSVPFGSTNGPKRITVSAEFAAPSAFATTVPRNTWNATLFPSWVDSPTPAGWTISVVAPNPHGGDLLQGCGFNNCKTAPSPAPDRCQFMEDVDFPLEKSVTNIPVEGPDECCMICKMDTACAVAVFENTSSTSGVCHIKTTLTTTSSKVRKPGWMSAFAPDKQKLFPKSIYLTTYIDHNLMETARAGSVVLLLQNSSGASPLKTAPTRYKQAWWLGNENDNNAGTLVYKDAVTQTVLGGMAQDGFADQTWYRMIEGAQTFLLDREFLPLDWVHSPPTVMMRAIDIVGLSRSKALLFHQAVGKGHIIATGLNCFQTCSLAGCEFPEKAWLMDRLLRYGGSLLDASTTAEGTAEGREDAASMIKYV